MAEKKKKKAERCIAMKRNCGNIGIDGSACMYHYKADDDGSAICPICGTPRSRCGHWPLKGSKYCKYHSGSAGRPVKDIKKVILTSEEQEEVERATNIKLRHAENIYQKAYVLLKRVINNIDPENKDAPNKALKAVMDYFKNIEKPMSELKLENVQADRIQKIEFDSLGQEQIDKIRKDAFIIGAQTTANCFLKVLMTAIPEKDRRAKIISELPEVVRDFARENFRELE